MLVPQWQEYIRDLKKFLQTDISDNRKINNFCYLTPFPSSHIYYISVFKIFWPEICEFSVIWGKKSIHKNFISKTRKCWQHSCRNALVIWRKFKMFFKFHFIFKLDRWSFGILRKIDKFKWKFSYFKKSNGEKTSIHVFYSEYRTKILG